VPECATAFASQYPCDDCHQNGDKRTISATWRQMTKQSDHPELPLYEHIVAVPATDRVEHVKELTKGRKPRRNQGFTGGFPRGCRIWPRRRGVERSAGQAWILPIAGLGLPGDRFFAGGGLVARVLLENAGRPGPGLSGLRVFPFDDTPRGFFLDGGTTVEFRNLQPSLVTDDLRFSSSTSPGFQPRPTGRTNSLVRIRR